MRSTLVALLATITLAATAAATAQADSMTLAVTPEPVANLTSVITYSAYSEEGSFAVVMVNNPGVPCAANPAADTGETISPSHFLESGLVGQFVGGFNYTPPTTGTFTACGWLATPSGLFETDGGPVTAATTLPLPVRQPDISLHLSFPRRPEPHRSFALDLNTTTEVLREIVVEGFPLTKRGCPPNYEAESAPHIIEKQITGGPWLTVTNVKGLSAGSYVFCAWADPTGDDGLYPDATASLSVHIGAANPTVYPKPKRHSHRRRRR
jgi:hypothetical protein